MADTDIIVSQMPNASQVGNSDLVMLTQPNAQAETGYSTAKTTMGALAAKVGNGIEFTTDLSRFTDKTLTGAINENKDSILALLPIDEVSGAVANFDTDVVLPLIDVKAEIKALETGTGAKSPSNPYVISGFTGVNLYQRGGNLFNILTKTDGKAIKWADGDTFNDIKSIVSDYIEVKEGVRYTSNYYVQWCCYDKDKNYLGNIIRGGLVTTIGSDVLSNTIPSGYGVYYLRLGYRSSQNNNEDMTEKTDIVLSVGNTALPFKPYNGSTTVINLGGTYYGGYLSQDKAGHRQFDDTYSGLVNLPALVFNPTTKGGHTCFYADLPNGVIKSGGEQAFLGKCSTYTVTSNFNMPDDLSCLFYCSELYGGYTRILIRDDSASAMTGAQFTAYVTGQITYEKANPQTIDLPDGEPILAFNGINNIFNDTNGDTTVKYKLGIQKYIDKKIAEVQALVL